MQKLLTQISVATLIVFRTPLHLIKMWLEAPVEETDESGRVPENPGLARRRGNEPIGALAHLRLARAYALSGDTAKSRAAYQDFFALWKDANPDIPILKEAKVEYAKLQ
jgi:hypothetical protein